MHIIAHRGASKVCGEENTLLSFQRAIDLGCDFVELDVRRLHDGSLVCFHNSTVKGTALNALSLRELRERTGLAVPTLQETARLCAGQIGLDVELKEVGY